MADHAQIFASLKRKRDAKICRRAIRRLWFVMSSLVRPKDMHFIGKRPVITPCQV